MNKPITAKKGNRGFTLIELMIVVAIIAILAAVSYPSYRDSVMRSNRTEAKSALVDAAAAQEKWFFQQNQYTGTLSDIASATTSEGYYTLAVDQDACGDDGSCFRVVATATGSQAADTDCLVYTITQTGAKNAYTDSAGGTAATVDCW